MKWGPDEEFPSKAAAVKAAKLWVAAEAKRQAGTTKCIDTYIDVCMYIYIYIYMYTYIYTVRFEGPFQLLLKFKPAAGIALKLDANYLS